MTRRFALAGLLVAFAATPARGGGDPSLAHPLAGLDWHPDPGLIHLHASPAWAVGRGAVEQFGEVVILEGDDLIVTDNGDGGVGIVWDQGTQNPPEITKRFLEHYPDEFDEIIVYCSFRDNGSPGATAYEISTQQDVDGIGRPKSDDNGFWGSSGKLYAFVNMKSIDQFERFDGLSITNARSGMYPVLAQEFGHRWLAFVQYRDGNGALSKAMLGRDDAHWATTLQSDASVFDGVKWSDNGDGTYTAVEDNARFSPLDLYAMGLLPAEEVPPWYLLRDAINLKTGNKLNPGHGVGNGTRVRANREDIAIQQVIAAAGPRRPAFGESPREFRAAFVLVTRPGELAGDVLDKAARLEQVRKVWEQKFAEYTGGRGKVCTQVSAPCGRPVARVVGGRIDEAAAGSNGNGVIEPGEPVDVTFDLRNDGVGAASGIEVTASAPRVTFAEPAKVDRIEEGASARVTLRGTLATDGDALCGKPLTVQGQAKAGGYTWKGFTQVVPGTRVTYRETFDDGAGFWGVDLAGQDTTRESAWEWGQPKQYGYFSFYFFQPNAGHGGTGRAWFTGIERGNVFTGATRSLGKGQSTLWSPRIDLSSAIRPKLRYYAWFIALDLAAQGLATAFGDHLILEVSNDGVDWLKLDQLDGEDDRWRQRDVDLQAKVDLGQLRLDRPVQFRFRVNRQSDEDLVEAGVDDFQIVTDTTGCLAAPPDMGGDVPPPAGGCAVARRPAWTAGAPLLGILICFAMLRRRRGDRAG